jgi:hypothetical protein
LSSDAAVREFRKTNEAIGLRVSEGRLTLLTRKLFNVMIYHAQEQKVPGKNAPIDTPTSQKYFWVPLADLARDAAYDSKDTEFLKVQLQEMQDIKLLMENERQWTSERLVASVTLVNPAGLRKHGGQVWLGFAFPPETHELVMTPGTYTRLSIVYQSVLRSGSALALYEVCRRYATNPSHLTMIESVDYWYGYLTGKPVQDGMDVPYKYFKRDVIKPAIAELNSLTDVNVELIEHKNGRRIESLQFSTELKAQGSLAFPSPPVIDTELMEQVMDFGFSQEEAADVLAAHSDEKVRASVKFVKARIAQRNSQPLDSPAAYFRWTLREGAAAARDLLQQQSEATKQTGKAPERAQPEVRNTMEAFLSARAEEAVAAYRELDDKKRTEVFERFRKQAPQGVNTSKGIDSPMVRALFGRWYATHLWGEPSAEALARFIDKYSLDGQSRLAA